MKCPERGMKHSERGNFSVSFSTSAHGTLMGYVSLVVGYSTVLNAAHLITGWHEEARVRLFKGK